MQKILLPVVVVSAILLYTNSLSQTEVVESDKDCLECHTDYVQKDTNKFLHEPFKDGNCYSCHLFHGFKNNLILKDEINIVCTDCHTLLDLLDEDHIHAPVLDELSCINCHDPHSGNNKAFLKDTTGSFCVECHDEPDEDPGRRSRGAARRAARSRTATSSDRRPHSGKTQWCCRNLRASGRRAARVPACNPRYRRATGRRS